MEPPPGGCRWGQGSATAAGEPIVAQAACPMVSVGERSGRRCPRAARRAGLPGNAPSPPLLHASSPDDCEASQPRAPTRPLLLRHAGFHLCPTPRSWERAEPALVPASPDWLKIKSRPQQEFVVCGFTEGKGSRKHFGALLLGAYRNGRLRFSSFLVKNDNSSGVTSCSVSPTYF